MKAADLLTGIDALDIIISSIVLSTYVAFNSNLFEAL